MVVLELEFPPCRKSSEVSDIVAPASGVTVKPQESSLLTAAES